MVCGIDIGGTKMQCAVYSKSLEQVASSRLPTPGHDYAAFLRTLADMVEAADEIAGEPQAVGLALPGVVDDDGLTVSAHVPCINGKHLVADIERTLGRPVVHDNDTRTFTLSEARGGALDGVSVAVGVVLGTGVAGTLCVGGRPCTGKRGIAGEYGHIAMPPDLLDKYDLPAQKCICGAAGCAEQILSGPGLLRLGTRFGATYGAVERLLEDMRRGVPAAQRTFDAYIDCLGYFVSRLTLLLDPDVMAFGGGLSNVDEIYARLPEAAEAYLFDGLGAPAIAAPRFGATSGARGAAILALETGARFPGTPVPHATREPRARDPARPAGLAVIAGSIFDGDELLENHAVLLRGDTIADVLPLSRLSGDAGIRTELGNDTLVPGFIDLQVNGGGGVLFNDAPTAETIARIGAAHRRFGTIGFLPTLITDTFDTMRRAIDAVERAIGEGVPGVLGIHLEGPFLNAERAGVHDAARFRVLDDAAFDLIASSRAGVTVVTLAPELTDRETIGRLVDAGVIVCAGHSAADYEQARRGIEAGVTGFTHLYNAMTPLQSRAPGMVGAAIEDEDAWFGIIADGHHIHPAAFRIAVAAKRRGGALLVTDAMPPVGTRLRRFEIGGKTIRVKGGRCATADGSLAGSSLNMNDAVRNASRFADIDWFEAVRMASLYPARALRLDGLMGRIAPGYKASFVAVDGRRRATRVWIDGVRRHG